MKHVFFDIDGTLWDYQSVIPDSASRAIKALKANGHKAYISTGRTRAYITKPHLLELPFDGILSGLGTRIELNGKVLYNYTIDRDTAVRTVDTVRRHGFRSILEGPDYLYMDYDEFKDDPYGIKVMKDLGDKRRSISGEYGSWVISKLSCDTTGCDKAACYSELSDVYDYIEHNDTVVELLPKGFGKGKGIARFCEMEGIDIRDTVAIGDGANDVDMFDAAGFSVAMGNGADKAKQAADYVTTGIMEDGIMNALKHLGLV